MDRRRILYEQCDVACFPKTQIGGTAENCYGCFSELEGKNPSLVRLCSALQGKHGIFYRV